MYKRFVMRVNITKFYFCSTLKNISSVHQTYLSGKHYIQQNHILLHFPTLLSRNQNLPTHSYDQANHLVSNYFNISIHLYIRLFNKSPYHFLYKGHLMIVAKIDNFILQRRTMHIINKLQRRRITIFFSYTIPQSIKSIIYS